MIYTTSSSETCCPWRTTPASFAIVLLNHLLPGETIYATDNRWSWGSWVTWDGQETRMFYNSTSRTPAGTVLVMNVMGRIFMDALDDPFAAVDRELNACPLGEGADAIIEKKGLRQITDTGAIEQAIEDVMAGNPGQLADYRSGKDKLFGFFVGQVMKATGGKANPAQLNELLKKKLAG